MKTPIRAALALLLATGTVLAQEQGKGPPPMSARQQAEMEKMMTAMQAYGTLGPEHARLKAMAGSWDATVKMWMDAGMPPMDATGKLESKPILGDHYLLQEFSSDFMGQPFTGWSIVGYDNALGKYHVTWLDSSGTGVMRAEGKASKDGNTIELVMWSTDPMKKKLVKGRQVLRLEGNDKQTLEMYGPSLKGKEYKMMEIVYTRKK